MSEFDDINGDEGSGDGAAAAALADDAVGSPAIGGTCLSCGAPSVGIFCAHCGQKNDDLRRSSFILARDFMRDTFGFDSRMWRTLGLMAIAPGVVPKNYAHGKRSRFTPPVRLFLVVSFLFFVTIALTGTLFMAFEIREADLSDAPDIAAIAADETEDVRSPTLECGLSVSARFFVKEKDLKIDQALWDACVEKVRAAGRAEIESAESVKVGQQSGDAALEKDQAVDMFERALGGTAWLISDPRAFNSDFNNWLPRVMFFMTPVLALLLTLFIRGPDALIFDNLVLSLYTHAAGFAVVGLSLILAQFGAPYMGAAAFVAIAIYYFAALKRAYGRGWIKTAWTAAVSGFIYLIILMSIVMAIIVNIVWRALA